MYVCVRVRVYVHGARLLVCDWVSVYVVVLDNEGGHISVAFVFPITNIIQNMYVDLMSI